MRDLERETDHTIDPGGVNNPGFPVISMDGHQLAFGAVVAGPEVRRPVWVMNLAGGEPRLLHADAGGRPRLWLDDHRLLTETMGSGLNAFSVLDVRGDTPRPLLASPDRRLSNPRLSPDGRWLAFDAVRPGGSPCVLAARLDDKGIAADESAWISVADEASHPFWSRDGRLLYYLPTTPTLDVRNLVRARSFDAATGSLGATIDVLTLSETIVPAMISAASPIVAGDAIVFLFANYRGDVWIRRVC